MAVPKKRRSKAKVRQIKAGKKRVVYTGVSACPNCGSPTTPHRLCGACGYYNGRVFNLKPNAAAASESVETEEETTSEE